MRPRALLMPPLEPPDWPSIAGGDCRLLQPQRRQRSWLLMHASVYTQNTLQRPHARRRADIMPG